MKQINEQVSRIRKMMGLNENVNEFFSMPGEREGLPEPIDEEQNDLQELSPELRKRAFDAAAQDYNSDNLRQNKQALHKKRGMQADKFHTHVDPEVQKEADVVANLLSQSVTKPGGGYQREFKATIKPYIGRGFVDVYLHQTGGYSPNNVENNQIRLSITKNTDKIFTEMSIPENVQRRIARLIKLIQTKQLPEEKPMDEADLTGKQKDLAALAEPKDKITGADFAALRHGAKLEEEGDNNKYAKLESAIEKYGSRGVAVKLVDAVLSKMTGMFTASDLPDTATYANGLDTIEELLDVQDYKAAYDAAKETASDMLEEEGYSDFLGEKELSDKQKNIASQAPPYDKITGADFKALQAKKGLDEEMDNTIDPTYTHFAVTNDNKIVTGWEYKDLDTDSIKYYAKGDLKDMEIDPKTVKIYTTKTLMRMGVDPFNPENWKDIHNTMNEINPMDMFSFGDDEQDPSGGRLPKYNRKLIKSYVDAIEKRARVKKMGVTPGELYQRFNDMDDMPSRPDIEMLMYTLSQKGLLFSDPSYKNKIQPNEVSQYLEFNDPEQHTDTEKLAMQALDRNMNETVTLTKENMFKALSEAKKKGKVNPWAVCTKSVGRDDKDKYERCVMGVKKDQGIKK